MLPPNTALQADERRVSGSACHRVTLGGSELGGKAVVLTGWLVGFS